MALIPKFFMDAVLSIGERKSNGKVHWMGTGFFVSKDVGEGKSFVFLITNRHVLEGKKSAVIRLKEKDTGKLQEVDLPLADEKGKRLYSVNPNAGVDIAAILMEAGRLSGIYSKLLSFDFDAHSLTSDEFLEQGGTQGQWFTCWASRWNWSRLAAILRSAGWAALPGWIRLKYPKADIFCSICRLSPEIPEVRLSQSLS